MKWFFKSKKYIEEPINQYSTDYSKLPKEDPHSQLSQKEYDALFQLWNKEQTENGNWKNVLVKNKDYHINITLHH